MTEASGDKKNLSVGQELTPAERTVCEMLADGRTLLDVYREVGLSSYRLAQMRASKPAFDRAFHVARDQASVYLGDRLLHIHEEIPDAKRATVVSNNIKFYLERLHRKTWGQSLDVTVEHKIDVTNALAEARARVVRPSCDPSPPIDAEFVALPSVAADQPPDCESDSASPDGLTDIFSAP